MNLGFIILAHHQPDAIRRLTDILTTDGNRVVIHFDSSAASGDQRAVRLIAEEKPDQITVISKVHCVWGEWSLVEAVLLALREFAGMSDPPDYIHLMSGADFPLRPIAQVKEFLRLNPGVDFIESCDISKNSWVKGGLGKERFRFFFPFNFRTHRKAFNFMVRWQRRLNIRRRMPLGLRPHMGSQWWTLRWSTCEKVLEFTAKNPRVAKFFKSTWIPDESYFQTVIARIVPRREIADLQLMFHHLTPSGRPYVFYNDHLPILRRLPHFFIRKVSPEAFDVWGQLQQFERSHSRIPSQIFIARARTLIRNQIDLNHKFTTTVPGHLAGCYSTELRAAKQPLIVLFLTDEAQLYRIEEALRANPVYCWLGRPFASKSISMPKDVLARMGMTRASWKLRENFMRQFIYQLIANGPESKSQIPVVAILAFEDHPDLAALYGLDQLLLFLVKTSSLKSLISFPGFSAMTRTSNSELFDKITGIDLDDLLVVLERVAVDFLPAHDSSSPEDPPVGHPTMSCGIESHP